MWKIFAILVLVIIACSQKHDNHKEVKVKTDFQEEFLNIVEKDTFSQAIVYNQDDFNFITNIIKKRLPSPFHTLLYISNGLNWNLNYLNQQNRIISIELKFSNLKNYKQYLKNFRDIDSNDETLMLFADKVPDTIYMENTNVARYYQICMSTQMYDSSFYDYFIPDTIKLKLGLPKDYQSALPILSDTNIFR